MGGSKAASLAAPFALKHAVDALAAGNRAGLGWILAFAGLKAMGQALNNGKNVVLSLISRPLGRKLARQLYRHLLRLDLEFHTKRSTGALLRRLERSPRAVDTLLRAVLFTFAPMCCELAVVSVLLARQGAEVVAIVLAAFAVYMLFTACVSLGWVAEARRSMNLWDDAQSAKATEAFLNIEQVKLFAATEREAADFDEAQRNLQMASQSSDAAASFLSGGQQAITTAGLGLCLWCVGKRVCQGIASVGDIFMVQGLVMQLWAPLQFLGFYIREARQAVVDLDSACVLLAQEEAITEPRRPLLLPSAHAETPVVEFHQVSFRYGTGRAILDGACFEIPVGGHVALLGASGSGKSTVGRLIPRLADPSCGCVRFNGVDVRQARLADLRERIAVVSQDVVVFNATIRQNLQYARPGASDAELAGALRAAQLEGAVAAMPRGLDTVAGERGLCLSGGERQRLALARALLRAPELLVLDEATSALDAEAERGVLEAVAALDRRCAVLAITHRLTGAWQPDSVLVLEGGRIGPRVPPAMAA